MKRKKIICKSWAVGQWYNERERWGIEMKCLIIDDDKFERDGLRYMIDKMKLPIDVVDVRNGNLGLESMSKEKFDMVITDIKMPVMDGMAFLERAKQISPETVYIIYSGYSDFHYAKKAISFQVLDFLVKPVSDEEFVKVMQRAMAAVEKRRRETIYHMLECLKNGREPENFSGDRGRIILFRVEKGWRDPGGDPENSFFCMPLGESRYLGYGSMTENGKRMIWDRQGIEAGVISDKIRDWKEMKKAYAVMTEILDTCIFGRETPVIYEKDYRNRQKYIDNPEESWDVGVLSYLKQQRFLSRDMAASLLEIIPREEALIIEGLKGRRPLGELVELISEHKSEEQNEVIYRVKRYIKENYDRELTVEMLAREVFLTPGYLCTIFKKQTGTTLIHYLTGYRMEKAMELLTRYELKTSEVARMVGYHNISYFNLVFKERTGKTPRQYRKEGGHHQGSI